VLKPGPPGSWDGDKTHGASVFSTPWGYEAFYSANGTDWFRREIGYAMSPDGSDWTARHPDNPLLQPEDDPVAGTIVEGPEVVLVEGTYWMYYDYLFEPYGPNAVGLARGTVCCAPVEEVAIAGPALLHVGETGLYTATYTPPGATPPVTFTWSNGSTEPTAAYSWTMPGAYTITVTATNPCGEVQGEMGVLVCEAPSGAAFGWDPITPTVHESVTFTGTAAGWPAPDYHWSFDGITKTGPIVTHSYSLPGAYTVTLTATNACGTDAVSHTLTVAAPCIPVTAVTIAGPTTLLVGETGHYTATAAPPTATLPITYTWGSGAMGPTAVYSWTTPGTYTLTVTATNPCRVMVAGTYVVEVSAEHHIYLPLVMRP
jgi:PKD repeat protein